MLNEKQLRKAAVELNNLLFEEDYPQAIDTKASIKVITKGIKEAAELLTADDEVSAATQEVIDELIPLAEEEEEDAPEDDEPSLKEQVEDAEKLADLKPLVKANKEFKSLVKDLASYKKADDLRDDMLALLEEDEPEEEDVPEKIHKQNIAKKKVNSKEDADEDEEEEAPKKKRAGGPPKGVKPSFKKEGSMAQFMDNTVQEGGTWDEMYAIISKEAKKRGIKTSLSTVKSHVKFRVSKNAKFLGKLKITDDGVE